MESENWWPSRYGSEDQIGMLNEINANKVIEATSLVRKGRIYDLSRILDEKIPVFPGRAFKQVLITSAHTLNRRREQGGEEGWGRNKVNWITELASGTFQLGTHMDALNHLQIGNRCYNGFSLDDIVEEWGTSKLGIETAPQIVTRGVLLDIASLHGVSRLQRGRVVTVEDVQSALKRESLEIRKGDAVIFHTGWGELWMQDNPTYLSGEPGPGMEVARWLVENGVAITGCDTWSFGPVPPEDPEQPFLVPQTLNARHGMFVVENLSTVELSRDRVYEFMFILTHPRVRGATGAWISPVAII